MRFEIYPQNIKATVSTLNEIAGELEHMYSCMEEIIKTNAIQMNSYTQLKRKLGNYQQNVLMLSRNVFSVGDGLRNVLNEYEKSEQMICDPVSSKGTSGNTNRIPKDKDWSTLWDLVGTAGVVGQTISMIGKVLTGNKSLSAVWAEFVLDAWDMGWGIEDVVKTCIKEPDAKWYKEIFGMGKGALGKIAKANLSWSQKASHGFNSVWKNTMREFKTTAGCAKQVGGIVFSGVVNAIDNWKEYKENGISIGRMAAETVTETAVDWGKDMLIAAGVTAAFAAAGIAAPAVAVGVATVAISAAADWVCKEVFGKKLTETVSDAVLDGAAWVGNQIKTGAEKVKEGASALWKGISSGWNALTEKSAVFA